MSLLNVSSKLKAAGCTSVFLQFSMEPIQSISLAYLKESLLGARFNSERVKRHMIDPKLKRFLEFVTSFNLDIKRLLSLTPNSLFQSSSVCDGCLP